MQGKISGSAPARISPYCASTRPACAPASSLSSSVKMRSGDTRATPPRQRRAAVRPCPAPAQNPAAPQTAARAARAARPRQSGRWGPPTQRSTPARRSACPPNGSTRPAAGDQAIALTVKSPPRQILPHIGNKAHGVGVAAVAVGAVSAEGCDLPAFAAFHHGHRAVLFPVQQQAAALKQRFDLAGLRACADIPVLRRAAKQAVPHAAAHNERLVSGRLQRAQQRSHHRRQGQLQFGLHRRPPFTFFGVSQNAMFRFKIDHAGHAAALRLQVADFLLRGRRVLHPGHKEKALLRHAVVHPNAVGAHKIVQVVQLLAVRSGRGLPRRRSSRG